MISVKEAASILKVSTKTIYQWIDKGRLPSHRLGNQYYLERSEVEALLVKTGVPELNTERVDLDPRICDMLKAGGVYYGVPGDTKTTALYNALKLIKGIDSAAMEPIFQMFLNREEMASTGVGDGIAIPHARGAIIGYASRPLLSLSFLKQAVEYDAFDAKPVDTLFLLISPNMQTHLRILAKLAYLLHDPLCRESIIKRESAETILDVVTKAEMQLSNTGD